MPNIQSAKKRMRSDAKKNAKNQAILSELHTLDQKMRKLTEESAKAVQVAEELVSKLDKAVVKGVIPRGRADRKKSRIAHFVKKLKKKK